MPSVDKAIINPFEPLGVGEALLVAVSGLLIVFVMLAMLMAVILVISKIVAAIEGKGKAPAAPAPKSAAPAAKPAAAPAAPAVDEGELVAVMMAAVAEESGMSPNSFQITNISAAPAAAASKPARQVPFATTARSMRAAASPVIRSNGRRLRKLPSMGGFSAATPARAAAPTTSVRRCIFIRRSIRCSIPCRSRPNGGSRWRRRNSARRSAARRSCAAASGASKPMRRKTCAEREGNDCRRCIKKNCSVVEQFFFRYSENPYFLCRFR